MRRQLLSVRVVNFSAFYSFKGNRGSSARVNLVVSVKESSEQCMCSGTIWQLCLANII